MMDDIRPPRQDLQRRDYTAPVRRPAPHPEQPARQPAQPHATPVQSYPTAQYHRPEPEPAYHQPPAHQPPRNQHHHASTRAPKRLGRRYAVIAAILIVAAGVFTAGYIFKSKTPDKTLPSAVVAKANFIVFFPSPMPSGYIYVSKTATYQIGDIFYRFANGSKSVTVREEPLPSKKPNLTLYKGYTIFNSKIGQAAMGASFGQPVAVVVTPTTIITLNTGGGVAPKDLKTAIDNLHNIGSSSQGVSNG